MDFAGFLTIYVISEGLERLLRQRFIDLGRFLGPRALWRGAEAGICSLYREARAGVMRRASQQWAVLWAVVVVRTFQR